MYTAPFEYTDEERARQMIEVNLMAPFKITQTFIPLLKKHNANNAIKARVINIASWAGYIGQPFIPFYNCLKSWFDRAFGIYVLRFGACWIFTLCWLLQVLREHRCLAKQLKMAMII